MPFECFSLPVEALETMLHQTFCAEQQNPRPVVAQSRARGLVEERVGQRLRNPNELRHQRDVRGNVASDDACPDQVAKSSSEQRQKTRAKDQTKVGKKEYRGQGTGAVIQDNKTRDALR